jgi:hypothetical protein
MTLWHRTVSRVICFLELKSAQEAIIVKFITGISIAVRVIHMSLNSQANGHLAHKLEKNQDSFQLSESRIAHFGFVTMTQGSTRFLAAAGCVRKLGNAIKYSMTYLPN